MCSVPDTLLNGSSHLLFTTAHWLYSREDLAYSLAWHQILSRSQAWYPFLPTGISFSNSVLLQLLFYSPFSFLLQLATLLVVKYPSELSDRNALVKRSDISLVPHVRIPEVMIGWWSLCIWRKEEFSHWYNQTFNVIVAQETIYCWNFHKNCAKAKWVSLGIFFWI